jgi:hypothetical protein
VLLAGVSQVILFDSMFTEELIKALVLLNIHDMLLGVLRDLLLLDSHMDLEFSLGLLALHNHTELNGLLLSEFSGRGARKLSILLKRPLLDFLGGLHHCVVDVGVLCFLELLLSGSKLLRRASTLLKNTLLDLCLVSLDLRSGFLDALSVSLHVFCSHELTANGFNLSIELVHSHLR